MTRAPLDPRHDDPAPPSATNDAWLGCVFGLLILAAAIAFGIAVGALVMSQIAAPRSAETTERLDLSAPSSARPIGAPSSAPPPSLSAARSAAEQTVGVPSSPAATESPSPAKPASKAETEPPAVEAGIASYCAPTPTMCQRWGGRAMLGAVPSFRYGDRPYRVAVCRQEGAPACVVVTVVSYCGCPDGRVIDLSPFAFRQLAPLSRGLVPVTLEDRR